MEVCSSYRFRDNDRFLANVHQYTVKEFYQKPKWRKTFTQSQEMMDMLLVLLCLKLSTK